MKTTRMLKLKNFDLNFKDKLDSLMREFCAAKRFTYEYHHDWTLWNIVNKFLEFKIDEHKFNLKEVKA